MRLDHFTLTRRAVLGSILALTGAIPFASGQAAEDERGDSGMKVRFTFDTQSFTATLLDNPSARDFAAMLPLDLSIDDYSSNEKISYLPRKLTEDGSGPFANEAPGDLCYYAPWGNLALFYGPYRYSKGLIRIGRLDDGAKPLLTKGKFALRIERVNSDAKGMP